MLRNPNPTPWGFEYTEWREGLIRIACDIEAKHLNPANTIHGGVLLTMMDEAGALAGLYSADPAVSRHSVTVSLTGQFTGQAQSGRVVCTGTLVRAGSRIYFSRSEVLNAAGEMLAFGSSTHRYRNSVPGVPTGSGD